MSIFNKDFYPTPTEVLDLMGFDAKDKIVLEPSAGNGNIVDYLKTQGALDILTCEKSKDLAEIVKNKSNFLGYDFLEVTRDQVSHINMIVANPPFSVGIDHIIHMWEIAPDGCEIFTLINHDNLNVTYPNRNARRLLDLIRVNGASINLGPVFDSSERKTNVE